MRNFLATLVSIFVMLILGLTCGCNISKPETEKCYDRVLCTAPENTLRIIGQQFGTPDNPITDGQWALIVTDSPVEIKFCKFYLDGGHGIRVRGESADVSYCRIESNTFTVLDSLNRYVICVGTDSPDPEYKVINAEILSNRMECLEVDTDKHNLFVGHCINPYVSGNYVKGGGYGIGIKGCDNAVVEYNEVRNTSRQAIVEKSGLDCVFSHNFARVTEGTAFRVTDDIYGRQSIGSYWHHNTGIVDHPWRQVFSLSSPYDPITQGFRADNNVYQTNTYSTHSVFGLFYELNEFRQEFSQEYGSRVAGIAGKPRIKHSIHYAEEEDPDVF